MKMAVLQPLKYVLRRWLLYSGWKWW